MREVAPVPEPAPLRAREPGPQRNGSASARERRRANRYPPGRRGMRTPRGDTARRPLREREPTPSRPGRAGSSPPPAPRAGGEGPPPEPHGPDDDDDAVVRPRRGFRPTMGGEREPRGPGPHAGPGFGAPGAPPRGPRSPRSGDRDHPASATVSDLEAVEGHSPSRQLPPPRARRLRRSRAERRGARGRRRAGLPGGWRTPARPATPAPGVTGRR